MGKKNKFGSGNNPKENKPPKDNQPSGSGSQEGASGGNKRSDEKQKDAGQGKQQQQGSGQQQKNKGPQPQGPGQQQQGPGQQQRGPGQQQQLRGPGQHQQGPGQQPQGPGQQQRGPGQQQQPQGAWGQKGPKQQSGAQPQQSQGWGQQGSGQQQRRPSEGSQGSKDSQGTRQQTGTWKHEGSGQQQFQRQQGQGEQYQPRKQQAQDGQNQQRQQGYQGQQGQGGQYQQRQQGQRYQGQQGQGGQYQQRQQGQQGQGGQYQQGQGYQGQQGQGGQYQQRQQGQGAQYQQRQQGQGYQGQQGQGGQYQQRQGYQGQQGQGDQYQQRQQGQGYQGQQGQGGQYQQRQGYQGQQGQGDQYQQKSKNQSDIKLAPIESMVKRGTLGTKFEVDTNYLTLNLDKMPDIAYHYDVKIDPDRPRKFLRPAFELFAKKVFPNIVLAYDGKANAYSAEKLPAEILDSKHDIEVKVTEGSREIPFKVTMKATDDIEVDLRSLKTYQKERIYDKPMRALQCIEVVLSSPCHEKGVRAGRSFFKPPNQRCDLGDGFELWFGLYQAAMLCSQPLLNVDVSHKSFPSEVNLVQFYDNLRRPSPRALVDFLKGLRVVYTPPECFKSSPKGYKFVDVKDASSKELFKLEDGSRKTVAEYFASKQYKLKRPELPCIHVGSAVKTIYIPLEFLSVPAGQAIMRKDNENQVRQMIRFAATSTDERREKIMRLVHDFAYNNHPTVERFGLSVGNQFITVDARLLQSPKIQYARERTLNIDRPGEWMMTGVNFLKCDTKRVHQWAILNISNKPEISVMFLKENFITLVTQTAGKLGMSLAPTCFEIIEPKGSGGGGGGYRRQERISIKPDLQKLKANKISLVFVILPFTSETYAQVKQEAELSCGIVTQCIKADTMRNESRKGLQIINSMTVTNILLKVNAKLNGTNHKIAQPNEIALQSQSKIMFVGADVSHPSPLQKNLPSIVGVVASHDLNGTQYNMQYRLQAPGEETIQDMQEIFTHHLNVFRNHNGSLPDNVIYYRDGVSDGQFQKIEKIELLAMRSACKTLKCNAKFTCIIVVKRHHTRFFPKGRDGEGKFNNVKAGTVVDNGIVHPNEVQFFMVSHKAIQGTSKPTRYNVIVDDAEIDIDDLQKLTYNLCHLFPRCNRSVSYPAPAYLSHLVGLRGRAYIEGSNLNLENLKAEYRKRIVSADVMNLNPMYFV